MPTLIDSTLVAGRQFPHQSPRGGVPQPQTLLPAAAAISCPSGEKRAMKRRHRNVPAAGSPRRHFPGPRPWPFCRRRSLTSRLPSARKTDGGDRPLMALQRQDRHALRVQLPSVRPDLDRPFGIRRGQLRAVAREGHRRRWATRERTHAVRSSGLWLCRKRTTFRTSSRRQRAVGHPESTR